MMKNKIYWKLTFLADRIYFLKPIVYVIDKLRYGIFWPEEFDE